MASGELTPGRYVRAEGALPHLLLPGDYGRHAFDQHWIGRTPNGHVCNLSQHEVVEHSDWTITVNPSIEVIKPDPDSTADKPLPPVGYWHGYLERGIWREV